MVILKAATNIVYVKKAGHTVLIGSPGAWPGAQLSDSGIGL